jgi:hypothetical protein
MKDKKNTDKERATSTSSKAEWLTHIRSLGLGSVGEYERWCRRHGFAFNRRKTWRQEREERRVAASERSEKEASGHIRALGLESTDDYFVWCKKNGFRPQLNKNVRQRQKERRVGQQPMPSTNSLQTVTMQHIRTLGLENTDDYRDWCRHNKLGDTLQKTPAQLDKERAVHTLTLAKQQMGQTRDLLAAIHAGQLREGELKTALLKKIHIGFTALTNNGRDALLALLLHIEGETDLLSIAPGTSRWGRREGNTLVEGLVALAHHYAHWLQPVDHWRPQSREPRTQFGQLARHLMARYEVPTFMDVVWFRSDEEARRQQAWFVHLGAGQNIRRADLPLVLSKKQAHHFLSAPEHYTVEEALRRAQVLGHGGNEALADALIKTRLGRSFSDEAFWNSVVLFFVRLNDLDLERVGPIVNYIYHQKFLRDGDEAPPDPNFSMKSRSLPKLLKHVKAWEERWTREALLQPIQPKDKSKRKFSHFECEEKDERSGRMLLWSIQELTTARALAKEGDEMNHCVASYSSKLGDLSIWSLQVRDGERTRRVMTVSIDNEECTVTQAKGRFNVSPDKEFDRQQLDGGGLRDTGKLNGKERGYLGRGREILVAWLEREGIGYSRL